MVDNNFVLEQFSGYTLRGKRKAYRDFVYGRMYESDSPLKKIFAQCILGSEDFIKGIMDKYLKKRDISSQVPESKKIRYCKGLNDIAKVVAEYYGIDKELLSKKNIRFNTGRKMFVYLARKYTDNSLKQIRRYFGNSISEVAVSKLFSHTQEELANNTDLKRDLERIEWVILDNLDMYQVKTLHLFLVSRICI